MGWGVWERDRVTFERDGIGWMKDIDVVLDHEAS